MSYYDINNSENPTLQVQRILRDLDYFENGVARVKPDGVYGDDTRRLVEDFQKKYGLNPTGVVDKETWDLLHSIDEARRDATRIARAVHIFPMYEKYEILPNSRDNIVYIVQHMLNEILAEHDGFEMIEFTGIYDQPTQNAIKMLQMKSLNDQSQAIDANTFNLLADEYERINSRLF
ncbi:MAG: peptidoglycan-binding protein [Clostridia bacterium]|nr:peptidoglycan-binding protein [Clostridia bacterium]